MGDFKSSIRLGIEIDTQSNVESKLKTLVDSLNNKKIELDLTLKNNDVAKSLESLTKLLDNFQSKIGEGISLGDIDKIISNTTNGLTKLNGELLKTTQTSMNNDMVKVVEQTATAIGQVVTQSKTLDKNGEVVGEGFLKTTTNLKTYEDALEKVALSQKQLNALESNGFTNKNTIADLKNSLNINTIGSDNELSKIISKINELVSTESKIIDYSNKLNTLKASMANLTDSKFSSVLDNKTFEEIANKIDDARNKLKDFDGINFNGIKQQYTELSNSVANFTSQTIDAQKIEQTQTNTLNKNIELETKLNNAEFLNNQKNAYIELNKLLEQEYSIKEKLLSADKQTTEVLEKALITNQLNQTTQKSNIDGNGLTNLQKEIELENKLLSLKERLNVATAKKNDSNIASLTKEINDAQIKLEKMKQTFGSKLPSGFIESTEAELKKLTIQLQQVDGVNFVSIKNGLNAVKGSMEQTTTETKQFVNSLKEANNGGFFSNISNFLGKLGVFYGISQVVGEIKNQLKDASEYTIAMDKAFTNMQMITGKSKNEISGLVNQYKELGQQLHTTNTEMMFGMEEVTRAGYEGDEGKSLMEASILGSKISGQDTATTTQQLIAIKNAFDMTGDSMNHVVDIISKMDNVSATSFAEIANAIQRTAYSAQEAGTPFDNLVTYITTVSEKTRKSAETINEKTCGLME